jgi:isopenicillin-N N-acyltransferase-like protein
MKLVTVAGAPYKRGTQLGEECKPIALKLRDQFQESWNRKSVARDRAISHSQRFLPFARDFYEAYVEELRGYAFATCIPFEEVFAWFCYDPPAKGCTDFVFNQRSTYDKHVYMVHNEDYDVQEEDCPVLVRMDPEGEPSFLSVAYGGIWFNAGINEEGIGLAGNGLSHTDSQIGIPGDFSFRKTLSARTIGEAMNYSTPEGRSFSYCNIICDASGEMYAMEGSATDFAAIHGRDMLVHTNHYLDPRMAREYDAAFRAKDRLSRSPGDCSDSIVRYNRALNLALDALPLIEVEDMKRITADHVNAPWALCRHADTTLPVIEQSKTLFSAIIDVTERSIRLCEGLPCSNKYVKYTL